MDIRISPRPLAGVIGAIPSKSDAHRCILCAALADRPTDLTIGPLSEDIGATIACVRALGAGVTLPDANRMRITPIGAERPDEPRLDCAESGSTLRFLLPVAAALCEKASFTGRGRLPDRPLYPLPEEMQKHGCRFSAPKLPFTVDGKLAGGRFSLPGNISSQYVSGLLFALPLTEEGGSIRLTTPLESSGYVDMTIDTMQRFGIRVEKEPNLYMIPPGQQYRSPGEAAVDGDWSNAAFWLVAGALGGPVVCTGLKETSRQGDRQIAALLSRMGASVETGGTTCIVQKAGLRALEIDAAEIPDLVPILAVAASVAEGTTFIRNAARLRIKESDRLSAVTENLKAIGAQVRELDDGLVIDGKQRLDGGLVRSCGDHRIVMAMAIASAVCRNEIVIRDAEAVNKSYPGFFQDFHRLGGNADVIHTRS